MKTKLLILVMIILGLLLISCTERSTSPKLSTIPTPKISPDGATGSEPVLVYITCGVPEVAIRYTMDGSEPTHDSSAYMGVIVISENCTLKAKAFKTGYISSKTAAAEFLFTIADPEISPESGTYPNGILIAISCATPEANIYYTLNGTEPNMQSTLYNGSFELEKGCTLKAKAFKAGRLPSNTVSQEYSFSLETPQISPSGGHFDNSTNVEISSADTGASIRYTINGDEPTESSTLYAGALPLSQSCVLKAKAFKSGFIASETAEATFVFNAQIPQITPASGVYYEAIQIQMECGTQGAQIRYSLDGSEPDQSSNLYSAPFALDRKAQIVAKAFKPGYIASKMASATYTFNAEEPQISPQGGTYYEGIKVSLSSATPAAQIRYSLDGSEPEAGSTLYTAPIDINKKTQLNARSFKSGYTPSQTVSAKYQFQTKDVQISPEGGTYFEPTEVSLSCATPKARIYYTLDDSEPTEKSAVYQNPLNISQNCTLKAKAFRNGYSPSKTASTQYIFKLVETPQISPPGGSFKQAQSVKLSCKTPDAQIRYTTDGSDPKETSALYSEPLVLDATGWLKAKAYKAGFPPSPVAAAKFNFQATKPGISPAGGYFPYPVTVSISSTLADGEIRYTTDGSNPTDSSLLYLHPFTLNVNSVVKAAVFKKGWEPSEIETEIYVIHQSDQMQYVQGGTFYNGVANITLSSFYLAKYTVSELEWYSVMPETLPDDQEIASNLPICEIAWKDAIIYCNRRSLMEGLTPAYSHAVGGTDTNNWPANWYMGASLASLQYNPNSNGYRLPTDMEWMYAARGGIYSANYTYSGANDVDAVAWYVLNSNGSIHEVGTKSPNELGLYDMSGNVWEFCWDYHNTDLPDTDSTNPTGPTYGVNRVLRGGAFNSDASNCTIARRFYILPYAISDISGFRVLRKAN